MRFQASLLFATMAVASSFAMPASTAGASPEAPAVCHQAHATIHASPVEEGCDSPVGLCFEGTFTGAGQLNGDVYATALTLNPLGGSRIAFTEEVVLTTDTGTLVFDSAGVFDIAKGLVVEMHEIASGEGSLAGATGYLLDRTTFIAEDAVAGELEGVLCLPSSAP